MNSASGLSLPVVRKVVVLTESGGGLAYKLAMTDALTASRSNTASSPARTTATAPTGPIT